MLFRSVWVELFASEENAQETFFCTEDNSAFRHSWEDSSSGEDGAEPWLWETRLQGLRPRTGQIAQRKSAPGVVGSVLAKAVVVRTTTGHGGKDGVHGQRPGLIPEDW